MQVSEGTSDKVKKYKHYTKSEREVYLCAFQQQSKLNITQFAQAQGIPKATFDNWVRRSVYSSQQLLLRQTSAQRF